MPQGSSAVRLTNGLYLLPFSVSGAQHSILRGADSIVLILGFLGTLVGKLNPDTDTYGTVPHII